MEGKRKEYLDHQLTALGSRPSGPNLFYECVLCGKEIPSLPADNIQCECRNISVDVDAGRLSIRHYDSVKLFYR